MANKLMSPEANRLLVADAFLDEIERRKIGGKTKPRLQGIAIAHGLAYDPHVDGKLRLTPAGRARLARRTAR